MAHMHDENRSSDVHLDENMVRDELIEEKWEWESVVRKRMYEVVRGEAVSEAVSECMHVCACVRVCVRAWVRACVRMYVWLRDCVRE